MHMAISIMFRVAFNCGLRCLQETATRVHDMQISWLLVHKGRNKNKKLLLKLFKVILNSRFLFFVSLCSRTFMSIIGGVIAGILGFTGLKGFIFYFLLMAFTSLGLIAKAKFSIHSYFDSWNRVAFDGFLGGLMVLLLVITFSLCIMCVKFFF